MAKVFLDTNIFIDVVHRNPEKEVLNSLSNHIVLISLLSVHIYCYTFKIDVLKSEVQKQTSKFKLINLDTRIYNKSATGPTSDLEDNIQLHSAAEADCDIFLTSDKKLLKLGYFGKMRISDHL